MTACGLFDLCVKQGVILGYSDGVSDSSENFADLDAVIKDGRYGLFRDKGTSTKHLYVVLTQDCTISSGKPIELAQLRRKKVKNIHQVQHLFLGQDYSKLYLFFDGEVYEASENLLTKINSEALVEAIGNNTLEVKGSLQDKDARVLLDWRILAYQREPYPDKFNQAFKEYIHDEGLWFISFLKDNHENIHSVRVYVTPDDEGAEEYMFSITALLTRDGEAVDNEISEAIELMLNQLNKYESVDCIQTKDFDPNKIVFPEDLTLSLTVSLDDFTFANAYLMREYNLQYLCYEPVDDQG